MRAYLDVLAPDGVPAEVLFRVLDQLSQALTRLDNPLVFYREGVTVRFGVETGLLAQRTEQLKDLVETLRLLLEPQGSLK